MTACGGNGGPPPAARLPQQIAVPLLAGPSGYNPAPRVLVAMPAASPVSMLLDTGSTGLRILPSALANVPSTSYTKTSQQTAAVFGGDRVVYGTIAVANPGVTIGGLLRIDKPLDFQIVNAICAGVPSPVPSAPPADCNNITALYEKDLIGGTIGVRPETANPILSPLAELPAPYSNGFTISDYGGSPTLTVGTTSENQTGFELYSVGAATAMDGSPGWAGNEELPWCYAVTVPGSATVTGCPSTGVLTDSGGENERLTLPAAPPGTLAPNTLATVPPNSTIVATLTASDASMPAIAWTLTTGTCTYYDAPLLDFNGPSAPATATSSPSLASTSSNAIAPFYTHDVLYDLQAGIFGFRSVATTAPTICS